MGGISTQKQAQSENMAFHFHLLKIDEISYYEPYFIATASFAPPNALTIPLLHDITAATCETK